jgi:tRNA A-37 threonylcarbamoyl transferase component Bud32
MSDFPIKLGRYKIVKHLADGGMAQVLLARADGIEGFERHVVVKRIHGERAADPVFVKMFLDEARLAAQLHHNNIVQVHDIGKSLGEYFFAMEYVHGEDLRKLLMKLNKKREKVPFEHIVTIIATTALALHHAHEQRGADRQPLGLVHRDVSPANIIVGYDGNVKVVDFGIAKAALRTKPEDTKDGALKGKVSYMAPEQCSGATVDRRSDVFALGIVMFELTTVRRLFKSKNDFLTMSAIVSGEVPAPSSYRTDLPPELEAIMLKALAHDPENRFQTAEEMREALEQFAADKGLRMSTGALAGYMKQLFGHRPEPWLVEEPVEYEMTIDFDGSESGAAKIATDPAIPENLEPRLSSPIMRARKRAATGGEADAEDTLATPEIIEALQEPAPLVPRDPILPVAPVPVANESWVHGSAPTGSGVPLAWPTDVTGTAVSAPRRKLFAIGGALVGLVLVAIVALATRGGDGGAAATKAIAPPPPPMRIVAEPPPPPPPPAVVEPPPPAKVEPPAKAGSGSAAPPAKKVIAKKKKPQWNPDELFLPEQNK